MNPAKKRERESQGERVKDDGELGRKMVGMRVEEVVVVELDVLSAEIRGLRFGGLEAVGSGDGGM